MGEANVLTCVCLSVCPHPLRTCYTAVSMPLAFTQEDFLVFYVLATGRKRKSESQVTYLISFGILFQSVCVQFKNFTNIISFKNIINTYSE